MLLGRSGTLSKVADVLLKNIPGLRLARKK